MSPKIKGFGPVHIDDLAATLNSCAEGFAQLAALLAVIRDKAPEHSDVRALAALGWSVAADLENFAGCTLEQMQKGGIQQ